MSFGKSRLANLVFLFLARLWCSHTAASAPVKSSMRELAVRLPAACSYRCQVARFVHFAIRPSRSSWKARRLTWCTRFSPYDTLRTLFGQSRFVSVASRTLLSKSQLTRLGLVRSLAANKMLMINGYRRRVSENFTFPGSPKTSFNSVTVRMRNRNNEEKSHRPLKKIGVCSLSLPKSLSMWKRKAAEILRI